MDTVAAARAAVTDSDAYEAAAGAAAPAAARGFGAHAIVVAGIAAPAADIGLSFRGSVYGAAVRAVSTGNAIPSVGYDCAGLYNKKQRNGYTVPLIFGGIMADCMWIYAHCFKRALEAELFKQ